MMIDTWATIQNFAESFEDLSPAQINAMSFEAWAACTGRPAPAESAIAALDAKYEASPPTAPQQPPAPAQRPADARQGIDPDSDAYFHAWRASRARGGEGIGIMNADGVQQSGTAFGRSGYSTSNVVEPPRITGRHVNHDAQRDSRSAAERFSTPGNSNQF